MRCFKSQHKSEKGPKGDRFNSPALKLADWAGLGREN